MIKANVHSDDHCYDVVFEATAWFIDASDADIINLANCNWRGDYPADNVALFFEDYDPSIARLLEYCRDSQSGFAEGVGFECYVDEDDALKWLEENRPWILEQLQN